MRYSVMLLRPAVPEDALAVAQVHVGTWQAAYRTLIPDEYLDGLSVDERAQTYDFTNPDPFAPHSIIAEEDGVIVGFAATCRSRDESLPEHGELGALYVDPEKWGRGYGAALIAEARSRLVSLGFNDAMLWVLKGNQRAERFYQIDGWRPDGIERVDLSRGFPLEEIRYVRNLR